MVPMGLEPGLRSKNLDFREGSETEPTLSLNSLIISRYTAHLRGQVGPPPKKERKLNQNKPFE